MISKNEVILVTGVAGFIGFHFAMRLLKEGFNVVGIDNLNDYYDVNLKHARLNQILDHKAFNFKKIDICDRDALAKVYQEYKVTIVVHLAAQAGVRYSLTHPEVYMESNIHGFLNVLEVCKDHGCKHLIYASSSSVYGLNREIPFKTVHNVDNPVSLYAASKKTNELMAHTYSYLYDIPTTGLRFFTVYGPWGRPDMALYLFTDAITNNKPIDVYNHGDMKRDFTYIDDIIEAIYRLLPYAPKKDKDSPGISSKAPYRIFNIGNGSPVLLMDFIREIERNLNLKAIKHFMDLQPGDVEVTYADTQDLYDLIQFKPNTSISLGISKFVNWYKDYHKGFTK